MSLFKLENVRFKEINYPPLEVKKGKTTFICGESGVGKSTLLKLLNGVMTADQGEISYLGKPLKEYDSIQLRRKALLVSQAAYLFEGTIKDNFIQYYGYREVAPPTDAEMTYFLNLCSLNMSLDTEAYNLSGGEKQRVFIAINLSLNPEVVLLDEPTSALDEKNSLQLLSQIKDYCREQEKSLVVVSHDRSLVQKVADEIIELRGDK